MFLQDQLNSLPHAKQHLLRDIVKNQQNKSKQTTPRSTFCQYRLLLVKSLLLEFNNSSECTIRYDTVDLRALKSWRDGQLNLAHGPETKNNEKIKSKTE